MSLLTDVFKNVVMRVSLDRCPQADTHVAAFVERLRHRPALFFAADPVSDAPSTQEAEKGSDDEPDAEAPP